MKRAFITGLSVVTFGVGAWLWVPHDIPRPHESRLSREVTPALRYAEWCGGTVSVEPLHGGNHDVVVVGCDK